MRNRLNTDASVWILPYLHRQRSENFGSCPDSCMSPQAQLSARGSGGPASLGLSPPWAAPAVPGEAGRARPLRTVRGSRAVC